MGVKLKEQQKYLFIPLDIFRKNKHNINEIEKRDAWLYLLSDDNPDVVIRLIEKYPDFQKIYEDGYNICLNVERVMEMFSKELYELDRNTVQYMIDEMQDTIDEQKEMIHIQVNTIYEQDTVIDGMKQGIKATIGIMRKAGTSENEIRNHLISDYRLSETQAEELLSANCCYPKSPD